MADLNDFNPIKECWDPFNPHINKESKNCGQIVLDVTFYSENKAQSYRVNLSKWLIGGEIYAMTWSSCIANNVHLKKSTFNRKNKLQLKKHKPLIRKHRYFELLDLTTAFDHHRQT